MRKEPEAGERRRERMTCKEGGKDELEAERWRKKIKKNALSVWVISGSNFSRKSNV
jgi:hypothetical protein